MGATLGNSNSELLHEMTMAKKTKSKKKSISTKAATKPQARPSSDDQPLRGHLLYLLQGGGAHATFDDAIGDWPVQLAGAKVANYPHSAWMLLEHLRLAQRDILEFTRSPKHASPKWPEGYWPSSDAPASEKEWKESVAAFKKDLREMQTLVADKKVNLFAKIPWGDGQTVLREALLVADHNAYHIGQLVMLRKAIGI
jgi:hypothetical protein